MLTSSSRTLRASMRRMSWPLTVSLNRIWNVLWQCWLVFKYLFRGNETDMFWWGWLWNYLQTTSRKVSPPEETRRSRFARRNLDLRKNKDFPGWNCISKMYSWQKVFQKNPWLTCPLSPYHVPGLSQCEGSWGGHRRGLTSHVGQQSLDNKVLLTNTWSTNDTLKNGGFGKGNKI